jgi:hypothetical protein
MSHGFSRRDFMRKLCRWAGLAALGSLVWKTASHSAGGENGGGRQQVAVCERCAALPSCARPAGLRARRFFGKVPQGAVADLRKSASDVAPRGPYPAGCDSVSSADGGG